MTDLLAHLRSAASALARADLAAARAACAAALRVAPDNADALNLLGLVEFRAGHADDARAALERAVAANPRYANAWSNLAALHSAAGRWRDAVLAEHHALGVTPRALPVDWYNFGVRALRGGLVDLAGEGFERALALHPAWPAALANLAIVRDRQQRYREARELAERQLAAQPDHLGARYHFAAIWSKATAPSDLGRALEQGLAVLEAEPAHAAAHDTVAIVLGKLGHRARAYEHARTAVGLVPTEPSYGYTLARLLEEDGALAEAEAALVATRARAPPDARVERELGTVRLKRGDAAGAETALAATLALAPDDQTAIAQRGLALELLGRGTEAADWIGYARFVRRVPLAVPAPFADAESFHRELAQDVRQHSQLRFEPVGLAAKGGYLTDDLLADRTRAIVGFEHALGQAIERYIAALVPDPAHPFLRAIPRRYRLNLWATRVAAQGVIDTHLHETSWLSGAYYVELPPGLGEGEDAAGWIEFGRPHKGLPQPPATAIQRIRPEPGLLLLFPSYLYHRTLPFAGAGERISLSFDLVAID